MPKKVTVTKKSPARSARRTTAVRSSGMDENSRMSAALSYLFGWVTGVIFLLIESKNTYVRMHAAQSVVFFGILSLLGFVPVVNMFVALLTPVWIIFWIVFMVKAYRGERFMLPIIGDVSARVENALKM